MDKKPAKFRETLWFKLGEKVAPAPTAPAADEAASNTSLPVEDRYLDDGSVTRTDSLTFSVQTGSTAYLRPIHDAPAASDDVALGTLAREMKGRRPMFAALALGAVSLAALALVYLV